MKNQYGIRIHPLLAAASVVIIVAGMREIASVLNIILLSLLLTVSISPILVWLLRKGRSKALSLVLTIVIVLVILAGLTTVLGVAGSNMADKAPEYETRVTVLYKSLLTTLSDRGFDINQIKQLELFSPDKLVSYGTGFLDNLLSTFGNFFFVLLLMIFMLIEFADLVVKSDRGDFSEDSWQSRFGYITKDLQKYIVINAETGLMAAVGDFILLLLVGVDFAILWAFLSFFMSFIPNIGFIISVIAPALIALIELGWVACIIVVVGYIVINSVVDNVIKPRFLGQEFNMSILNVFLSLIFWGWVLGPMGAILGVPLTMAVQYIITFTHKDMEALEEKRLAANFDPDVDNDPEDEG
jgi:predicted PurR-regulated permease PerM